MKRGTKTKTTRCKSNDFSAPNRLWGKLQETEEQPARRKRKPIEAMIKTLAQKIRPVKPKLGSAAAMIAYAMMRRKGLRATHERRMRREIDRLAKIVKI